MILIQMMIIIIFTLPFSIQKLLKFSSLPTSSASLYFSLSTIESCSLIKICFALILLFSSLTGLIIFSDETRQKLSIAIKGEKHYFYGKKFSEEYRKKIIKFKERKVIL